MTPRLSTNSLMSHVVLACLSYPVWCGPGLSPCSPVSCLIRSWPVHLFSPILSHVVLSCPPFLSSPVSVVLACPPILAYPPVQCGPGLPAYFLLSCLMCSWPVSCVATMLSNYLLSFLHAVLACSPVLSYPVSSGPGLSAFSPFSCLLCSRPIQLFSSILSLAVLSSVPVFPEQWGCSPNCPVRDH